MTGRTPGSLKTPGSGRKKGSLDLVERRLVTSEIANDILGCYLAMGGPKFLLEWAQQNKTEFVRQCLARLMPAFQKDDPDTQINIQNNYNQGGLTDFQVAQRIAFALRKGIEPVEAEPVKYDSAPSPQESCRFAEPAKPLFEDKSPIVDDAERAEYWRQQQLSDEEKLTLDTRTKSLHGSEGCYRGSNPEEQGRVSRPARVNTKESVREKNKRNLL